MRIVLFSKIVKDHSIEELIRLAGDCGLDGFDLCVRAGYPVNPDNAAAELPRAAAALAKHGLSVPMVTGSLDLVAPDHPTAEPILAAMDRADVRLLKLGYFEFYAHKQDYWAQVDRVRRAFDGWQKLAARHNVRVCYHTHSGHYMGANCAMLAHLLRGFDPRYIGADLDPGHMVIDGEPFAAGLAMVKEYLSIVAVKDPLLYRADKNGHGCVKDKFVEAGRGMVDWTCVFDELARAGFDGPVTAHCEHEMPADGLDQAVAKEVEFFRAQANRAASAASNVTL